MLVSGHVMYSPLLSFFLSVENVMGLARSQRTSLPFGYWLLWSTKLSIEDLVSKKTGSWCRGDSLRSLR